MGQKIKIGIAFAVLIICIILLIVLVIWVDNNYTSDTLLYGVLGGAVLIFIGFVTAGYGTVNLHNYIVGYNHID